MKFRHRSIGVVVVVLSIFVLQMLIAKSRAKPLTASPQAATQPTSQPAVKVQIENFTFKPRELQIAVGGTVTWQNTDDVPHTATSKDDPQLFDSGPLDTDETFSFTFTKPGTYTYYCKVHPHMTGVITVK
jgi:plastocyanin